MSDIGEADVSTPSRGRFRLTEAQRAALWVPHNMTREQVAHVVEDAIEKNAAQIEMVMIETTRRYVEMRRLVDAYGAACRAEGHTDYTAVSLVARAALERFITREGVK